MRRWSEVAERVSATTRTSEKTRLLADEFRELSAEELPVAAIFWTGRPFPRPTAARRARMGGDRRGGDQGRGRVARALGEAYDRHSDLGKAVDDVLAAPAGPRGRDR